jgi:hypothetical protein
MFNEMPDFGPEDGTDNSFCPPSGGVSFPAQSSTSVGDVNHEGFTRSTSPIQCEQSSQKQTETVFIHKSWYELAQGAQMHGVPGELPHGFLFSFNFPPRPVGSLP